MALNYIQLEVHRPQEHQRESEMMLASIYVTASDLFDALQRAVHLVSRDGWTVGNIKYCHIDVKQPCGGSDETDTDVFNEAREKGVAWTIDLPLASQR